MRRKVEEEEDEKAPQQGEDEGDKKQSGSGKPDEKRAARKDRPREPTEPAAKMPAGARMPAGRVLEVGPRILLWGEAGTGKSTLLRWLAYQAIGSERIPVWIDKLQVPGQNLAYELAGLALARVGLPNGSGAARQQISDKIASGKASLFLDALDEAQSGARISLLSRVASLGPDVRAIVSSRPDYKILDVATFVSVDLLDLAGMAPEALLRRYHGREPWIEGLLRDLFRHPGNDQ